MTPGPDAFVLIRWLSPEGLAAYLGHVLTWERTIGRECLVASILGRLERA